MRGRLWVFCLFALAGFAGSPASPSPIAREVVLAPGQTAAVSEASISLRFVGVSGDSRCPADAVCIQGGDALVQIEVLAPNDRRQPYVLHTGDMRPVSHEDLTISLVQLVPYPFSSRTIHPDEYRATLRITR